MLCGETDFENEEDAINHVNSEHSKNDGEFEASSDSDEEIHESESADETEGSSGDESSEIETSDGGGEYGESDNEEIVSPKKGKPSAAESTEVKVARALISEYVESLRGVNIVSMTTKLTQEL